jgi:hypothetical protein
MYVYMYARTYVRVYVYLCICVYLGMYVCVCVGIDVHIYKVCSVGGRGPGTTKVGVGVIHPARNASQFGAEVGASHAATHAGVFVCEAVKVGRW